MITGAVSHRSSVLVPSLDDARKTVTFGSTGDVDFVAFVEHVAGQFLSERVGCTVCETEFTEITFDFDAGFLEVTGNGFVYSCFFDRAESDLYGFVSVVFFGLDLHNGAGARFDDGDGDNLAVSRENLAHSEFFPMIALSM